MSIIHFNDKGNTTREFFEMKEYKKPELEVTAVLLDDIVTLSSYAVKDKGKDTPWISATPGLPSYSVPGFN